MSQSGHYICHQPLLCSGLPSCIVLHSSWQTPHLSRFFPVCRLLDLSTPLFKRDVEFSDAGLANLAGNAIFTPQIPPHHTTPIHHTTPSHHITPHNSLCCTVNTRGMFTFRCTAQFCVTMSCLACVHMPCVCPTA